MKRVAILGLGLMGGSIGLGLKQRGHAVTVAGYARREETRTFALERGLVDEVFSSPADAVAGADVVILCLPIMANVSLLQQCKDSLSDQAIVTDVGSTKLDLTRAIDAELASVSARYVGSHPVAGSEKTGAEAAMADLYQGALVIVTPSATSTDADVQSVLQFWQGLGSRVLIQSPEEHDAWMARTSHLPHMAAVALVAAVARSGDVDEIRTFCGSGFRDTSRVAEGSPSVWLDILQTNRQNMVQELSGFRDEIEKLCSYLASEDDTAVEAYLARCRELRRALAGEGTSEP